MGQTSSGDRVTPEWAEVQRQAFNLKELAFLTYESFTESLKQLNQISRSFADSNGKRLIFIIKPGTDSTLLWKATVKIGCVRVDVRTEKIVSYRLLNLKQYMQVYRLVLCQVGSSSDTTTSAVPPTTSGVPPQSDTEAAAPSQSQDLDDDDGEDSCEKKLDCKSPRTPLTTSMILDKVWTDPATTAAGGASAAALDECCICLERKTELILPCAHSYCVPCIEQWNVSSKTCPVCREALESTDDSWVISEAPDSLEVEAELQKLLNGLAKAKS